MKRWLVLVPIMGVVSVWFWLVEAGVKWMTSVVVAGMFGVWFLALESGLKLYYNVGPSLAPGFYSCVPYDPAVPLHRPTILQLEPSAEAREVIQRFAPQTPRTDYWLKRLVAEEGDTVCLHGDEVTLHGEVIAHRPLLQRYPLAPVEGCWTLGIDDIFVLGDHPQSYDARYSGPWWRSAIRGTCEAVWTWEAGE